MIRCSFVAGILTLVLSSAALVHAQAPQIAQDTPNSQGPQAPASFDSTHRLIQQAAYWANYQRDVNYWGSRNVVSAKELETALLDFAKLDGAAMASSWMAVNALNALQTPEFVAGIRQWESWYGRDLLLQNLHKNPTYVLFFPGADAAQTAILHAAERDARRLKLVGDLFKKQAYAMQKQSWANLKHGNKQGRLAAIGRAPNQPKTLRLEALNAMAALGANQLSTPYNPQGVKNNFLSALRFGPRSAWASSHLGLPLPAIALNRELTITHILGLAALLVLNEDQHHPNFGVWMADTQLRECVDWSRVHLNQCVAAGHFVFESSFCIAEHQLIDAGECVASLAANTAVQPHAGH